MNLRTLISLSQHLANWRRIFAHILQGCPCVICCSLCDNMVVNTIIHKSSNHPQHITLVISHSFSCLLVTYTPVEDWLCKLLVVEKISHLCLRDIVVVKIELRHASNGTCQHKTRTASACSCAFGCHGLFLFIWFMLCTSSLVICYVRK